MNPIQMIGQILQSGGNPQNFIMGMMKNNNNPMAQNAMKMLQNNDAKGIEQMARNLCQSNGVTPEQAIENAKKMFGM